MVTLICALIAVPTLKDIVAKTQDAHPRDYHFVCEYLTIGSRSNVLGKKRIQGNYHLADKLSWTDVSIADTIGDQSYGPEKPQGFMNGFTYRPDEIKNDGKEAFFATIPAQAVECRNLVWDTHMFEGYAYDHLGDLSLNKPFTISKEEDSPLAGAGNFHAHDVNLTWIGEGEWNGTKCALIRYRAFLNTFTYMMGTMKFLGTSDYWGEIWLAKRTKRIECATIYESVTVVVGDSSPIRSFRTATFEAVKTGAAKK